MEHRRVLIYGAGGLGREVLDTLRQCAAAGQDVECAGFVVDPEFDSPAVLHGVPVYRDMAILLQSESSRIVVAIGDPSARLRAVHRVQRMCADRFTSVVHQQAYLGNGVNIGVGTMVLGVVSITTDVEVGRHVVINTATSISHDCRLGDYATLGPAVALTGGVKIGEGASLGVGANVAPRVEIGPWAVVGAATLVLHDLPADCTAIGSPARIVKRRPPEWHLAPPG